MEVTKLVGQRVLATFSEKWGASRPEEFKILEVSPSGNWARLMNAFGTKSWRPVVNMLVVEQLQQVTREAPPAATLDANGDVAFTDAEMYEAARVNIAHLEQHLESERSRSRIARADFDEIAKLLDGARKEHTEKLDAAVMNALSVERDYLVCFLGGSDIAKSQIAERLRRRPAAGQP